MGRRRSDRRLSSGGLLERLFDVPRQQRFELLDHGRRRYLRVDMGQVVERFKAVRPSAQDERVQIGTCSRSALGIAEHP